MVVPSLSVETENRGGIRHNDSGVLGISVLLLHVPGTEC